jgi:hypothetical protein
MNTASADWLDNISDITISSGVDSTIQVDLSPYLYDSDSTISITDPYYSTLDVHGDANFNGDLKIKGKSLIESIENIEKRLAILHPNSELESRWEKLKELGEQYRQLEKDILEKESIWETLKK